MSEPVLSVRNLETSFPIDGQRVPVVDGVSLEVAPGEVLALVGESGCGKSVTAFSIMRLIPRPGHIDSGQIILCGRDLLELSVTEMRRVRGGEIAMIFQEPMTSLNPVYTIGDQIVEAILLHQDVDRRQAVQIAVQAMIDVGIGDPRQRLGAYPHQFSGGMRQRVVIALA
ncbi:MAG: ABC transporter ATP-binding protein, partial [Myxococcales bacterium]|nr:ABC transporter ATP-binding protein [Myxococcales bacterium]